MPTGERIPVRTRLTPCRNWSFRAPPVTQRRPAPREQR